MSNNANDKLSREDIIKSLYSSFNETSLPDEGEDKNYYFDEGTGTWYILTGKKQIDRPSIDMARKYFEKVFDSLKNAPVGTPDYQKALYCAVAIEGIDKIIKEKD